MDAVILAIKPMYAERILVGRKRFEYRRKCRCIRGGTVVLMYATAPVQAIVGHFTAGEVIRGNPPDVWRQSFHGAGIERPHYEEYFAGAAEACAIGAMEPVR
jgi:predicted transcriptional regulator